MKTDEDLRAAVPAEFLEVFRDMVRAFQPRGLDHNTPRVYWRALCRLPLSVIRDGAAVLQRRSSGFFPTTAEWFAAAVKSQGPRRPAGCTRCGDKGLIRIDYHSGECSDLAICDCAAGQWFRTTGEDVARANVEGLPLEARVAYVEDYDEVGA
jgi:hypothetical protein